MNEPETTIVGNLTADPELRFTPSGRAVANFIVASTPRSFDKNKSEYVEGETFFLRCSVWNDYAENVAESLEKGMTVIAHGRLKSRTWEDNDGNKRTNVELDVNEVGPTLRFATARVRKHKSVTKLKTNTTTGAPNTSTDSEELPF
jgi:single-strand DNA-binding protein